MSENEQHVAQRRGFLKTLGLAGGAAVAATAAEASAPLRADAVPAGTARKENQADRLKARYQPNSAHVQAFYRTNRSSDT
ncbi:MAG: twin-arginine translocation signal domain-containing protein [Roseomonas sp.]|nr:twin-arginine translocation signal domain-containing protein [Roseomonas sp.]MCA3312570.1 twin-arginine translocation signal domain-containing protein [Roseomonas sp.]